MRRVPGLVVVVVSGLALGAWARAWLTPSPHLVVPQFAFSALFEEYCVPIGHGLPPPDLAGLEPVEHVPGEIHWVDPASGFQVQVIRRFDRTYCSVGAFIATLTRGERNGVRQSIGRIVASEFPDLAGEHSTDAMGQHWMKGPLGTPDRWGISILDTGGVRQSFVVSMYPRPSIEL